MIRKSILCGAACLAFTASARATVLFSDSFNSYPNGELDNSGYVSPNPTSPWTETSRPQGQIQVTSGVVGLNYGGSSGYETVGASFSGGTASSGTVYAGFDLNLSALPTTSTSNDAFAAFKGTYSGLGSAGRVIAAPSSDGTGSYQIGISDNSSTISSATFVPTDLNLNITYRIVEAYSLATDSTTIYVNPTSPTGGTASINTDNLGSVGAFALTDAVGLANPSIESFDNLVVGTAFSDVAFVPEPTSLTLLGLGGLALVRRRRA